MKFSRTTFAGTVGIALVALAASGAKAHHSFAMFDNAKVVSAEGAVKLWEFRNPHAFLWVYCKNASGGWDLYGFEGPGVSQLTREGWNKSTVGPGDKIAITYYPLRDGRKGGSLITITLPDGRSLRSLTAGKVPDQVRQN